MVVSSSFSLVKIVNFAIFAESMLCCLPNQFYEYPSNSIEDNVLICENFVRFPEIFIPSHPKTAKMVNFKRVSILLSPIQRFAANASDSKRKHVLLL